MTAFVIVVVVVWLFVANDLDISDKIGSVVAASVALGTAIVVSWRWAGTKEPRIDPQQEADALTAELINQWAPEIQERRDRFGDRRIIPLTWKQATGVGSPLLRLDGELNANPDEAASALAKGFGQIPQQRLVVLGEPGAGKTFLAIMLAVGLLRRRAETDKPRPVPVFLALSSWDPLADSLDEWIVRALAAAHYSGNEQVPRTLMNHDLIMPVLDGLDELPEHVRRQAVSRVNDTLQGNRPLVLTCRHAEYVDGLAGGAPVLLRAPVVDMVPLSSGVILSYLRNAPVQGDGWAEIIDHIDEGQDGAIRSTVDRDRLRSRPGSRSVVAPSPLDGDTSAVLADLPGSVPA